MANQGRINFGVGFQIDKTGLNELKTQLQSLQNLKADDLISVDAKKATAELEEIKRVAGQVEQALENSFNPKLNTTDLAKFRQELATSGLSIKTIQTEFNKAGESGKNAFRSLATELLTTNKNLRESSKWLDKMAETMANTVRWSIASSALNSFTESIQKAWTFTKQLDSSLNNIQIVTGKSADEMERFAAKATKAAQSLGATTRNYTDAALIYYQQGLSEEEVQARSETTVKVANITGQSAQTVSEQLTAVWNGYKVSAQESELYIDKLAAVAARTAADLEELSTGMSKVASAANIMGVDIDQLNAQLATIVSVTREAPESIGTALKTVYARMSDIEAGLDTETTLGEYTAQMAEMGINALDANGNLRDMGEVVEEIGDSWDTLSRNQQVALAQTIAGTRQYSRMMALFDNWDMYQEAKATSVDSAGEIETQQERYLDSMEAHLNKLTSEAEELYQTLMDPKGLNPLIDALTSIVGLVENVVQSLGGGAGLLGVLGAIGMNAFSNQITKGAFRVAKNITGFKENLQNEQARTAILEEFDALDKTDEVQEKIVNRARQRLEISNLLTEEEKEQTAQMIRQTSILANQSEEYQERQRKLAAIAKDLTDDSGIVTEADFKGRAEQLQTFKMSSSNIFQDIASAKSKVEKTTLAVKNYDDFVMGSASDTDFDKRYKNYERALGNKAIAEAAYSDISTENSEEIAVLMDDIKTIESLDLKNILDEKTYKDWENAIGKIRVAYDETGKVQEVSSKELQEATEAIKTYNKVLDIATNTVNQAAEDHEHLNEQIEENNRQQDRLNKQWDKFAKGVDLSKSIEQVVGLAGGLANVGSSMMTIINLPSIWGDDNLSGGEKLLQTITSMGFALPMLINGLQQFKAGFSALGPMFQSLAANIHLATTSQTIFIAGQNIKISLTKAEIISIQELLASEKAENIEKAKAILLEKGLTEAQATKIISDGLETKGLWAKVAAQAASHWYILAIIAALVALGVAINATIKAYNKEADAAKLMAERANNLAGAYTSVKSAYDDLKTSISDYQSARTALDELTQGTSEWKEQILEANEAALELIRNNAELAGKWHYKNGLITFDEGALEDIQNQQQKQVLRAQRASLISERNSREADIILEREQFQRASGKIDVNSVISGIGTITSELATAFLSEFGGFLGENSNLGLFTSIGRGENLFKDYATSDQIDELTTILNSSTDTGIALKSALEGSSEYENEAIQLLQDSIGVDKNLAESLYENKNSLLALTKSIEENNRLLREEASLENSLFLQEIGLDEKTASIIGGMIASDDTTEERNKWIKQEEKEIKNRRGDNKELVEEWLKATGTEYRKGSVKDGSYLDAEGNKQKVDWDVIAAELAEARYIASQNTSGAIEDNQELLEKALKGASQEAASAIEQIFASNEEIVAQNLEDFTYADIQYIKSLYHENNELYQELNESQKKYLRESVKNLEDALKNIEENQGWLEGSQDLVASILGFDQWMEAFSQVSFKISTEIGNALNQLSIISGTDVETAGEFLSSFGKDISTFISSVAWDSDEVLADIIANTIKYNGALDYSNEATYKLISSIAKLNGESLISKERLGEIQGILENISKFGDTISASDYAQLYTSYGDAMDSYFTRMENGTYALTTAASEFLRYTSKAEANKIKNEINNLVGSFKDAAEIADSILNSKLDVDIEKGVSTEEYYSSNADKKYTFNSSGQSFSWNELNKTSGWSEADAIRLIQTYIAEGGTATAAIGDGNTTTATLSSLYGGKIKHKIQRDTWQTFDKFDLSDIKNVPLEVWQNLVEESGGNTVKLDWVDTTQIALDYKDITSFLRSKLIADSNAPGASQTKTYRKINELTTLIRQANEANLISSEQASELYAMTKEKSNLLVQNNSTPIEQKLSEYIRAWQTSGGSENLNEVKEYINQYLQTSADEIDFNKRLQEVSQYENLFGDEWKDILKDASRSFNLKQESGLSQAYQTSISSFDNQIESLDNYLQVLQAQEENLVGEQRTQNLEEQNEIIRQQIQLLKNRENLEKEELRRQLAFNNETEYDTENDVLLNATEFEANIKRAYSAATGIDIAQVAKFSLQQILDEFGIDQLNNIEDYNALVKALKDRTTSIGEGAQTGYTSNIAAIQNTIGTLFSSTTTVDILNKENELVQNYIDHISELNDIYEEQLDYLDDINSMLENQISLMELLYGENASAKTLKYYKMQREASAAAWETDYNRYKDLQQEMYKAQDELETAQIRGIDIETAEQVVDAVKEKYFEAAAAVQESMTQAIEAATTYYEQEVQTIVDNFTTQLFGADFERFKDEIDWASGENDVYLDSVNKQFQKDSLRYQYQSIINSTNDLKVRERLTDIMERELAALEEKEQLTEKDFERAKALLEVEQARLALEDARTKKTQMRLVLGENGYSYQYVADNSAIAEAEQRLAEAENQLYNFDQDRMRDTLTAYYDAWTETIDKINAYREGGFSEDEKKYLQDFIQETANSGAEAAYALVKAFGSEEAVLASNFADLYRSALSGESLTDEQISALLDQLATSDEGFKSFLTSIGVDEAVANEILKEGVGAMSQEYTDQANALNDMSTNADKAAVATERLANAYKALAEGMSVVNGASTEDISAIVAGVRGAWTDYPIGLDTGGYTGAWGPTGKLAVLHEKELVLNSKDTLNILNAVELAKSFENSLYGQLKEFMGGLRAATINQELAKDMTIEQKVEISANFPNATDRTEIEEAFSNLINLASQHAHSNAPF